MVMSATALRVCGGRPAAPPGLGSRRTHRRRALRDRRILGGQQPRKEDNFADSIIALRNEMNAKLDTLVDYATWKEANNDLGVAIGSVRDMVSSLRLDAEERRREVDETLAAIRQDVTTVEANLEETKANTTRYMAQAVNGGPIDAKQRQVPMVQTTQGTAEVPQVQHADHVQDVSVTKQRQVPIAQTEHKTVEPSHAQHVDNVQDAVNVSAANAAPARIEEKHIDSAATMSKVSGALNQSSNRNSRKRTVRVRQEKPDNHIRSREELLKEAEVRHAQCAHGLARLFPTAKVADASDVSGRHAAPVSPDIKRNDSVASHAVPHASNISELESANGSALTALQPDDKVQDVPVQAGDLVCLRDLHSRPDLNGAQGAAVTYYPSKLRWSVELLASGEKLLLKTANMTVVQKWSDLQESLQCLRQGFDTSEEDSDEC